MKKYSREWLKLRNYHHIVYKRYCNKCGKFYIGIGEKFCSRKCANALTKFQLGKFHPAWRDDIPTKNDAYLRYWRHKKGISKKYISKYGGQKMPLKHHRQRRKSFQKAGGLLTIKTIQKVYEDNIKYFETLTCIYCLEPISFGKDSLEHIIPLSRGGSNDYKNLAIACCSCNSSKRDRLIEEVFSK